MKPKTYIKRTRLNKADTVSKSLKTIVPIELVRKHGLKVGSELYWDEVTIKDGSLIGTDGEKLKSSGIEQLIIIRS